MKTNILSKRFSTIIVFLLAALSALLLFTSAPKQVTKADEEENEVLATYTFSLINNDTEYSVDCSNKSVCTKAEIPSSHNGKPVTMIGESAFRNCSSLTSVTIPASVTSIWEFAFYRCSSLTTVTIPNSVTSIEREAFEYCSSLTSVTIGNSVTSIGDEVFYGCSSLTSITIPDSVEEIGAGAFYNCRSLTNITIPNSVTSIEYRTFAYCSSLTTVTIPNSVTSIGVSAFAYCSGLTSVTIPDSVTWIGDYAFGGCSGLTSVTIGNSVTGIGANVFYNCSSLTSVTIYALNPPVLQSEVFPENLTAIYIPAESVDSYIGAEGWSEYETLIQPIPVQENNNETPVNTVNSAKTGSDVAGNSTGVMVLSTVILLVSAVAIVAVIKRFGLRRY